MPAAPRPRDVAHNVSERRRSRDISKPFPLANLQAWPKSIRVTPGSILGCYQKGGGQRCPPPLMLGVSGFQNRYDLVGVRIHNHDLLVDEDVFITTPFRIDRRDS